MPVQKTAHYEDVGSAVTAMKAGDQNLRSEGGFSVGPFRYCIRGDQVQAFKSTACNVLETDLNAKAVARTLTGTLRDVEDAPERSAALRRECFANGVFQAQELNDEQIKKAVGLPHDELKGFLVDIMRGCVSKNANLAKNRLKAEVEGAGRSSSSGSSSSASGVLPAPRMMSSGTTISAPSSSSSSSSRADGRAATQSHSVSKDATRVSADLGPLVARLKLLDQSPNGSRTEHAMKAVTRIVSELPPEMQHKMTEYLLHELDLWSGEQHELMWAKLAKGDNFSDSELNRLRDKPDVWHIDFLNSLEDKRHNDSRDKAAKEEAAKAAAAKTEDSAEEAAAKTVRLRENEALKQFLTNLGNGSNRASIDRICVHIASNCRHLYDALVPCEGAAQAPGDDNSVGQNSIRVERLKEKLGYLEKAIRISAEPRPKPAACDWDEAFRQEAPPPSVTRQITMPEDTVRQPDAGNAPGVQSSVTGQITMVGDTAGQPVASDPLEPAPVSSDAAAPPLAVEKESRQS